MQILIRRCAQRLESKVINDQHRYSAELLQFALIRIGGSRRMQCLRQGCFRRLKTDPGVLLAVPKYWAGKMQGDHCGNVKKSGECT